MTCVSRYLVPLPSSNTRKMIHDQVMKPIGFAEDLIEDISGLDEVRVPGSCEWLTSKYAYKTWSASERTGRRIFWLSGNAGSGKSILCSHVIHDLQDRNLTCRYFFFKHGIASQSTVSACLRELAHQIAQSDKEIFDSVLETHSNSTAWHMWDEKKIWRQLFLEFYFRRSSLVPEFWVIDALDECQKLNSLFGFLAQTPPHLRIFVTSRATSEIRKGFDKLSNYTEIYQLQPDDTLQDLAIFIDSRMDYLPVGGDESRKNLKARILGKSCGSFMWVSLVVRELEEA
jgi:hypothetical protein